MSLSRPLPERVAQGLVPILATTALMITGCTQPPTASSDLSSPDNTNSQATSLDPSTSPAASADQLQVVTTFLPLTNFTQAVAGDRAQVSQLLPLNVTPHDYQAKPQDAQQLAQADLLIKNGLEFESFLTDLVANADNADLTIVDTSKGVEPLPEEAEYTDESDHDDHADHAEHDDHADHDDHTDHAGHDHGDSDPHIWLDPKKAIQQVENIRDALIAADPDGANIYTSNAADYIGKLQALDQKITAALAPYADQTFVTYHDFSNHFAHSYDLEVEYLVNIPESSAAPADMQRVIEAAQTSNLKTLLSEPQQQSSPFEAIARDLNIQVSTFDPLETSGPEGLEPNYYLTVMEQNLTNLEAAFGKASP